MRTPRTPMPLRLLAAVLPGLSARSRPRRLRPRGLRLPAAALLAVLLAAVGAACGGDGAEPAGDGPAQAGQAESGSGEDDPDGQAAEADADSADADREDADGADSDSAAAGDASAGEPERPSRIVSLSPTATETLWAIGAADQVTAVDSLSYYPEATPVTEIEAWNPNIEVIAGYEPDLVVMQASAEVEAALDALGIEVLAQPAAGSFEDVYAQIAEIGDAVGRQSEAAALAEEMRGRISDLVALAPDGSGLSYYHELDNTLYSVTSSTFIGEVYALFGLDNVADPADSDGASFGYPQLSEEYLLEADPDLILLADTICCGQDAETVAGRPGWDRLSAVQSGNVIELDDDVASRWGPRLVDFVAEIAKALQALESVVGAA